MGYIKMAAVVLLALITNVGKAQVISDYEDYHDGTLLWHYVTKESGETCRIWPDNAPKLVGEVTIPENVRTPDGAVLRVVEIVYDAFARAKGVTGVRIPDGVVKIDRGAFAECVGLQEITLPRSLDTIGSNAFLGCENLTRVTFPKGVRKIMGGLFVGCTSLTEVKVEEGNANYCVTDGILMSTDGQTLVYYPMWKQQKEYTVPSSVRTLESAAFDGCEHLEKVLLPDGVTSIPGNLFHYCKNLKNVTIPNSVTRIEDNAFSDCSALPSIQLPNSLVEMGEGAFSSCTALTSVTIPHGVKTMGNFVLYNCPALKEVFWLASEGCTVGNNAFSTYNPPSTLYVRKGLKTSFEGKEWTENTFSITEYPGVDFTDVDGTMLDAQLVKPNGKAQRPVPPTKEGHTFQEWLRDGSPYDFDTPVEDNITLVAQWIAEKRTITFDADGGDSTPPAQEVDYGQKAKQPSPAPQKSGFLFKGWLLDGNPYDFNTPVKSNITLVAQWEKASAVESVLLEGATAAGNPFGEELTLLGLAHAERISVYSVIGVPVYTASLRGETHIALNTTRWATGVYLVRITARDGAKVLRVVKR